MALTDVYAHAAHSLETWPVEKYSFIAYADNADTHQEILGSQDSFELASVTKLLSAWTVLIAQSEGICEWDTPIASNGATVEQLLSHSGGINDHGAWREPGQRRIYSSVGYEILADYISAEADMPFSQYMGEALLEPLGMGDTVLYGSAGWAMRSTTADLYTFMKEIMHPQLIDTSIRDKAMRISGSDLNGVVPGYGMYKPCDWGLGFELKGLKSGHWMGDSVPLSTCGHFGQAGTFFWLDREEKRGAICLTNRNFGEWAKPLWQNFNTEIGALKFN